MQVIKARNLQQAFPGLLHALYAHGERKDGAVTLHESCSLTFERPDERLLFWPGVRLHPAALLDAAYSGLAQAETGIPQLAQQVVAGSQQFLFSTPVAVYQAHITSDGRFASHVITTLSDPMTGVAGQLGLQLSILHEQMAIAAKRRLGPLTVQHLSLSIPEDRLKLLLANSLTQADVSDPYAKGEVKPRSLDLNLEMAVAKAAPMGLKSKWTRSVYVPLQEIARLSDSAARRELHRVKASDWRLAMECYLDEA